MIGFLLLRKKKLRKGRGRVKAALFLFKTWREVKAKKILTKTS